MIEPTMVDQVIGPDLSVQQTFTPSEFGRALDEELAATMTTMMIANVQNGAASNARIDGVEVAGKTGTGENGDTDPYTCGSPDSHPQTIHRLPSPSSWRMAGDRVSRASATPSPPR